MTSVLEVINTCIENVNASLFTASTNTITVDGTSCTKKTAILNATGRPVTKVQRHNNAKNANTFGPSMIGYVTAGMVNQSIDTRAKFNDRSPLNVLEWHLLWKLMDLYVANFANTRPDPSYPLMARYLEHFIRMFTQLKSWYVYKHFRSRINGIAFIDSNVRRCDQMHTTRNEGSDKVRASWLFYTPLQNLMYKVLYPEAVIDMDWFNDATTDVVVEGVSVFLNSLLSNTSKRTAAGEPTFSVRLAPPIVSVHDQDFTMHNITTHVYRSVGRAGVKRILDTDNTFDVDSYTPNYVTVGNAIGPHSERWRKWADHKFVEEPSSEYAFSHFTLTPTNVEEADTDSMF